MTTALVPLNHNEETTLRVIRDMGDIFVKSGYFKDARDQAQAVVKILYGRELGFSPVISMSGIHIIEGKPALSANLMGAMVKRSGKYNYKVDVLTDTECTLTFTENGQPMGVSSFTMQDATRAGVVRPGSGWSKYPRNMLFSRALSNGVKLYCPELSACPIYVPEELGAEVNEEGNVTSHPVEQPKKTAEVRTFGNKKHVEVEVEPEPTNIGGEGNTASDDQADQGASSAPAPETTTEPAEEEFCTREQQDWLRLEFKAALPAKYQPHADQLRRDWLKLRGFVKSDGVGSSTMIPRKTFKVEAKEALKHAKGLK